MRSRLAAAGAILLAFGRPAFAHRLDEYLQATTISVAKGRVVAEIRLTPGVAVFPMVLASIDADGDGAISEGEQQAYAERVIRDLSLTIDGDPVRLRLVSSKAAAVQEMREGRGDIRLALEASVSRGGHDRRLVFENHHQSRIAVYLVNCLVPSDPDLRVTAQSRDYKQSFYQLDYVEGGDRSGPLSFAWWRGAAGWLGTVALILFPWLALSWRQRARGVVHAMSVDSRDLDPPGGNPVLWP
jgi:hypothetical protein